MKIEIVFEVDNARLDGLANIFLKRLAGKCFAKDGLERLTRVLLRLIGCGGGYDAQIAGCAFGHVCLLEQKCQSMVVVGALTGAHDTRRVWLVPEHAGLVRTRRSFRVISMVWA